MATFVRTTYLTNSTSLGTNIKAFYNLIKTSCPILETIEIAEDTTSAFTAYFRMIGETEYIFKIYGSSKYIRLSILRKDAAGTVTVDGNTYSEYEYATCFSSATSSGYSAKVFIFYDPETFFGLYVPYTSSSNAQVCLIKVKDMCTGLTHTSVTAASTSSSYLYPSGDVYTDTGYVSLSVRSVYDDTVDTGYTRVNPLYWTSSSIPCYAFAANPNLFYRGVAGGAAMSHTIGTEFSVNGVNFVALGGTNGLAMRLG